MKKPQSSKSFWVWIPLGLALGLFVTFILFLDGKRQQQTETVKPQEVAKPQRAKPVFDFYTVLPEQTEDIEQVETNTGSTKPAEKKPRQHYILQVGSFNNFADADELKAQLAFLGLEATLNKAQIKSSTWYRVELGPFSSDGKLSKTKNLLIQNKIKYLQKKASS